MIPSGAAAPVADAARLRHELRTPINLVVGYCEMLLEDVVGPPHAARRDALEAALAAAREALALVADTLRTSGDNVDPRRLSELAGALHGPEARIVGAMDRLVGAPGATDDPALVDDAARVRHAARDLGRVLAAYEPQAAAPPAGARVATVLVVDDIEANRTLLERRLRREGHTVLCAADGPQALERMAALAVDLVLLDVMMPGMDGIAVLERMKADPALRELPVVMISAIDDVRSVAACIERGADDFLPKPFDPMLLRARVGALLERKRLRDQEMAYLREVDVLARAAGAVEEGTYVAGALAAIAARPDALGRLARVLDAMAVRVRSREDRLHAHIRRLEAAVAGATIGVAGRVLQPDDDGPLTVGTPFAGRYLVRELLGRGGMGTVYLADDQELGEPVALKVLPRGVVDDEARRRFKSEIRLARRISHRNVVRTHDLGLHDGVPFVTMEYVRGVTLRELLDTRGAIGAETALAMAAQLARGLAVAHEAGVIHRDVKPHNLLLDAHGVLKIMDFGVARLVESASTLTRVGTVVGTPAYMSPEQLLGEDVDARSDLYAAGVVLFEALTGRHPFTSPTVAGLIGQVLTQSPPEPCVLVPAVPRALSDLVCRMLARVPGDRPASASEVADLLDALT